MSVPFIVEHNRLTECTEGKELYYKSPKESRFEGVEMSIRGTRMRITCSLHSLYSKWHGGRLDNSGFFTMSQAVETIHLLFDRIGIGINEAIKVSYFEIGLNIPVEVEALKYISVAASIGGENEKEFFNDANYEKDRQRTTEKSKNIKKVFKMYDKTFEYRNKGKPIDGNILRIETMFRRQSIPLSTFISLDFINRLTERFYKDWDSISFPQKIEADVGVRTTQIEKARYIMEFGRDKYLSYIKELYDTGEITKKQSEQARAFVREWDSIKRKFRYVSDNKEVEYKCKLVDLLTDAAKC